MEKSNSKKILFKFFEGKHTTFEAKMIEEWLIVDENKELYFDYLNEWELLNPQVAIDVESRFATLSNDIEGKSEASGRTEHLPLAKRRLGISLQVAASVILFFLAGGYFLLDMHRERDDFTTYRKNVEAVTLISGDMFEKRNLGEKPSLVNLPDGSSVLLQPKAKISYNYKTFGTERREVIMEGEAFFEVYKDAQRPFIVYANDLIAKVLGTSFTVRANPQSSKAEVLVKSGKVSVFTQTDSNKAAKVEGNALHGLVLNPFEKIEINSNKALILKPEKIQKRDLSKEIETLSFNFDEANAVEVLTTLEKAYNVDIVYDKAKFSTLKLTAHLGDEPLSKKLNLICLALETTYQEIGGKIVILSQH